MRALTTDEATVLAQLLHAGVPMQRATDVFIQDGEDAKIAGRTWSRQAEVQDAIRALDDGKSWHELSDAERHARALRRHYASLSFYLWSTNYAELVGEARSKADAARVALEQKLAGTSGQRDSLHEFYQDVLQQFKAQQRERADREEREILEGAVTEWES